MPTDLSDHVAQNFPISLEDTYSFLREIINAVSWLEQMSIIHADVRPPNILIDGCGHVKLCDFDNATFIGKYIQVGNEPYYEEFDPGDFGIAGPESEQGAIGCCAYFICTGKEPENRHHATEDIGVFGTIIRKCWAGQYPSIKDLGEDMFLAMSEERPGFCQPNECQIHVMDVDHYNACLLECRQYLSINGVMAFVLDTD